MDSQTRKFVLILLLILALIGLLMSVFLFVMLFLKNKSFSLLQDTISKQATLQAKTVDTWGNYTDAKNVKIMNQLRFYDYMGEQNEKFVVKETPYVQLREHHLVNNLNFHHQNEYVDYFRQIIREPDENKNKFVAKFPNFLGIFFWNKIQNLPIEERTWMALSGLMGKLVDNEFFKKQIQSTTLWDQLQFKSYSFVKSTIFTGLDLTEKQMQMLHGDYLYGLGTKQGVFKWIQYIDLEKQENENLVNVEYQLKNYFQIKKSQVLSIYQKIIPIIKELEEAFKTEFMCKKYCTSQEIFNKQWSQSQLSLKFLQQDTIADDKEIFGFLEYNKFYNEKYKDKPEFKDAYMNVEQTENLLAIDIENFTCSKTWNTLIHKTNIKEFLQIGQAYEKTQNENVFQEMVERFKLRNVYQAIVIYEYLKYMGNEFLLMNDLNGNMEITALANVGAEYFERFFNNTNEFLKTKVLAVSFQGIMQELSITCQEVLKNSIQFLKPEKIDSICQNYDQQNDFINELYSTCEMGQKTKLNDLSKVQIYMLCEEQSDNVQSYYSLKQKYLEQMADMYQVDVEDVSSESFVVLQFLNGKITSTQNKYINDKYPVSQSIQTWMPEKFRNQIELQNYAVNTQQEEGFKEYDLQKFKKLMSISGWFNGVVVQRAVLTCQQGDMSYLKEHFDLENFDFFFNYLKYFMKEVIVGGDYINVNQDDGVEGVISPFLKEFAEKQVLKGGDPSIPYKFQILKPYEKANIQKNTGQKNFRLTDSYVMFQDKPYVPSQPQPYFNGNSTTELFLNPYEEPIGLQGFELQSNPFTIKDDLKNPEEIHIPPSKDNFVLYFVEAIGRILKLKYKETVDLGYHSFIGYKYEIDDEEFEANEHNKKNYDQNINGFFNGTSVLGGPVYISRNRFYGVKETEIGNVQILDEDGNIAVADKQVDNLWINSEKYTGCGVNINVNLQINMKIDKNILFDPLFNSNDTLYPLFNIHVVVNFEDEQYDKVLGDLRLPYNIFNHYILYLLLIMLLFILLTLGCLFGAYRVHKSEQEVEVIDDNKSEGLIL